MQPGPEGRWRERESFEKKFKKATKSKKSQKKLKKKNKKRSLSYTGRLEGARGWETRAYLTCILGLFGGCTWVELGVPSGGA